MKRKEKKREVANKEGRRERIKVVKREVVIKIKRDREKRKIV